MKKLLLSIFTVCSLGIAASAQSVAIYEGLNSTTDISGTVVSVQVSSSVYEGYFFVKNLTQSPLDVKIRRVQIVTPPSAIAEQICCGPIPDIDGIGTCVDIPTNAQDWLSPLTVTLDETNKANMEIHVDHHGATGLVHNRYYVEDANGNKLDSLDLKVGNLASVKEIKSTSVSMNAYPNPASDVINIAVQGASSDNSFRLVDVLGNIVIEDKMGTSKKLDVSNFKNGVYILTVYSNGSALQSRRIVVRH